MILAITTGAIDATAFQRLGHVFASVITGNLVLLAVSAVHVTGHQVVLAACALIGYALGVGAGTVFRASDPKEQDPWPAGTTKALGIDLVFVIGFAAGWELVGGRPDPSLQVVLLGTVAIAMGSQSEAVRQLGQMSTTYLTSTLTGLAEALIRRRSRPAEIRSVSILLAALVGAACATLLLIKAPRLVPIIALAPLVLVLASTRTSLDRTRGTAA